MASKLLSTPSLLDLIDLFEQSGQPIANGDGQRLYGVPGWSLRRKTALSDSDLATWTERVGYAACYPAPCGDEPIWVDIEEDDDPEQYRYRCPETFRTKYIAAETVAVRAVTAQKFLNYLADLLDIPQALRRGITAAAIDGSLWNPERRASDESISMFGSSVVSRHGSLMSSSTLSKPPCQIWVSSSLWVRRCLR